MDDAHSSQQRRPHLSPCGRGRSSAARPGEGSALPSEDPLTRLAPGVYPWARRRRDPRGRESVLARKGRGGALYRLARSALAMKDPLLCVEHLKVEYRSSTGSVVAIPDLSFEIAPGESLGIVGESGCGKSTLLMAIMGHLGPSGAATAGRGRFQGQGNSEAPLGAFLAQRRGPGRGARRPRTPPA